MRLNRRIENWPQTCGVVLLFSGAGLLAFAIFGGSWQDFGHAAFSLWLGSACWRAGCERAASGNTPPSLNA
jgi:hypothetical protein